MDVFGKLNEFLNKEDDSFKYDAITSPEESPEREESSSARALDESINIVEDISAISPARRTRAGRKRKAVLLARDPDESFDLTGDSFEVPIGKSRRKLADNIEAFDGGQIDLCFDIRAEPVPAPSVQEAPQVEDVPQTSSGGKRGRARKKPAAPKVRKPRKMSYKKALEIINQPIPDYTFTPPVAAAAPPPPARLGRTTSNSNRNSRDTASASGAVDLTGEVILGPQHSQAPLFQKNPATTAASEQSTVQNTIDWDEEENDDFDTIKVNVRIRDAVKTFKHHSNRRFYDLFKQIAESESVPISNVFCFLNDKRIYPECTPETVGHKISSIYNCTLADASTLGKKNKSDRIELKFQSDKWKRPIALKGSRVGALSSFLKLLCKQVEFTAEQISLSFDGDPIDISSTPMDNDFEGGEILDCRVKA